MVLGPTRRGTDGRGEDGSDRHRWQWVWLFGCPRTFCGHAHVHGGAGDFVLRPQLLQASGAARSLGLAHRLGLPLPPLPERRHMALMTRRPKVLLIVDHPQWAFATIAHAIKQHIDGYDCDIVSTHEPLHFDESSYDIIHVFFETEKRHIPFLTGKA